MCAILVGIVVMGTTVNIVLWILSLIFEGDKKSENSVSEGNNSRSINKEIQNLSEPTKKTISNCPTIKNFILAFSLYTTIPNLLVQPSPSALKALGRLNIISNLIIVTYHVQQFIVILFPSTSLNN